MSRLKIISFLLFTILLSGCATLNFSSKYYTLPTDYEKDIAEVWSDITTKVPLQYSYSYSIVKDTDTRVTGMPQITDTAIAIPEYFIKYVWEFYYPNHHKAILTCVILHEMAHREFNLTSETPQSHYLVDKMAMDNLLLPYTLYMRKDYLGTLFVCEEYWSARKGALGNILLFTTMITIGGVPIDDFSDRIWFMHKDYPKLKSDFKRSH